MANVRHDNSGRILYNPELHPNHRKEWTIEELEYLCKFYEIDGSKAVSLALGRVEGTILNKVHKLRKIGLYEHYKKLNKFYISVI